MTTPEGRLKREIKAYLNARGIYWAIIPEGAYGKSGDPDIIACYEGLFVGLEAKTYEGHQSNIQKVRQREIEDSGGVYAIVRSVEEVEKALDMAVKHRKKRKNGEGSDDESVEEDTFLS